MTPKITDTKLVAVRKHLSGALRAAIEASPGTTRALARSAKVSHVALQLMARGSRLATPNVALKVADALEEWSESCQRAAKQLRAVVRQSQGAK